MSEIKGGGPAFPVEWHNRIDQGMTLRDYFAAKAMQGLIAASGDSNGVVDYAENPIADSAYAMADAMLRARGE
jgi:hypothetical protein